MRITKLHLSNFRNYMDETIEPGDGVNLFVGPNGQGKSAILEAAYVLTTSKSHRTAKDSDLIRIGSDWARILAEVDRVEREEVILELTLSRNEKKTVRINRVKHEKVGDIVGQLNTVIFSSADLEMVKSDPSHRRRFMNLEISQVSPQYIYALGRYKRVLEQRNSVLKEAKFGSVNMKALEVWDEQLVNYGSIMIEKRMVFLRRLSEMAEPIYNRLAGGSEVMEADYHPSFELGDPKSIEEIKEIFHKAVINARENDLARRTTTRGPHRDDISFKVNGMEVRSFGSQGQQRSVALAVKLAEIELLEDMIGETPVALLDDVGAELDEYRRQQVFDLVVGRCQALVTATSLRELPEQVVELSQVFNVSAGTVEKT